MQNRLESLVASAIVTGLLVATAGCSLAAIRGQAQPSWAESAKPPTCTESGGAAAVDFLGAAGTGIAAISTGSQLEAYNGVSVSGTFVALLVTTGLLATSGIYGVATAAECRQAKAMWAAMTSRRANDGFSGPPGMMLVR